MKYVTKTAAREAIAENKDNTNYFNGEMDMESMKAMLQYRMGFGTAETNTIMAALVLAGAKFKI